jgi:hypothetical protein
MDSAKLMTKNGPTMSHGRHTTPKELQLTHRGQLECSLQSIGAGYSAGVIIVETWVRFSACSFMAGFDHFRPFSEEVGNDRNCVFVLNTEFKRTPRSIAFFALFRFGNKLEMCDHSKKPASVVRSPLLG